MITIRQKLNTEEYKKALYAHFFSYTRNYIFVAFGVFFLLIVVAFCVNFGFDWNFLFILLAGFMLIIRPVRYVQLVLNSYKTSPDFGKEVQIQFLDEEDKIIASSENSSSTFKFKDLYAYCDTKRFLFLYVSKNQFMIINKDQMNAEEVSTLLGWIGKKGIQRR